MVKTIGNPLSWAAQGLSGAGHAVGDATSALGGEITQPPEVRTLTQDDLRIALRKGYEDFKRFRSDVMFLMIIYPIIGVCLSVIAFHQALLPMLFPLGAGFLLLGPIAAVGLYEMSRRGERDDAVGWGAALAVLKARNVGPILVMAVYLLGLFLLWILAAMQIYQWTLGPQPPESLGQFVLDVATTGAGWMMVILGMSVGAAFAALVLAISLTTLPMLIDQRVGLVIAVVTSLKVARKNPVTVATWGFIVAMLMLLGTLPFFLGLIIVLPILGHATWYIYRAAVPRG
ncbi:DUF2189 domain-containing protein [Roseovarius sp. A21]|uniref:DUF2189 domain-containing protein n=1 Tax=Roseovarius bejariae TaxID=2576383 RepID=A0A844D5B3_9RHOB|nr:DUF2189 domain-containing protein [Roseovarius bejariae]MRU16498.1 DUF2189 domain-containing protein [Roseovarius bejariae]